MKLFCHTLDSIFFLPLCHFYSASGGAGLALALHHVRLAYVYPKNCRRTQKKIVSFLRHGLREKIQQYTKAQFINFCKMH